MNEQQKVEFLRRYKLQNPRKYAQKYGDVPPEEAVPLLKFSGPFDLGSVKVQMGEVKEVEMEFKEPVPVESVHEETPEVIGDLAKEEIGLEHGNYKPKKARKAK
jgi:hypothetical protein